MLQQLLPRSILALGLAAFLTPLATHAQGREQVREVVSKQVSVGRSDATLSLEFSDDGALEVSFQNGSVLIDGEPIGSFEPGGELDLAWRELLGQAVSLEDGPLSAALTDWTVPADLAGSLADVAQEIDRALEQSLSELEVQVDAADGELSISIGNDNSFLRALLGSTARIASTLADLSSDVQVHIGEDVTIGADETVAGNLVVIEGDLRIEGEVDGSVVVIDGAIDLLEGSSISGSLRYADADVRRNEGSVREGLVEIEDGDDVDVGEFFDRDEIRDEIRAELRSEFNIRDEDRDDRRSILSAPFRSVGRAAGGLLENVFTILILGLIGAGAVVFAGDKVDVIAETARRSPRRAAVVGFAGSFLFLPAWILGFVALAISIIGIPVAIAWLPLFPLAAVLAGVVGYLAVARNTGEWLADSDYPWTGWIRKSNPLITMVGGLVGLMALFAVSNVLSIVPFFGFITGLLATAAVIVTFLAVQIGFGAVILTRAGRRREHWSKYDPDAAWEAAMSVDVEEEEEVKEAPGPDDVSGEDGRDA